MQTRFGKVAVLMGGASAEREVSLMSGKAVLAALQGAGVDAHAFDPADTDLHVLKDEGYDRAFLALHGRGGEDGTVQGMLEMLGIPYTGSGVMASALSMDKWRTKMVWLAAGLPTPRFHIIDETSDWAAVAADLGLPIFVKPVHEGSSMGATKVTEASQLADAWALAARFDTLVIAEEFIEGQELTIPFLGDEVLPVVRIVAPGGNYDYQN
ncbi:MAG TPA: D-alanine--D-alanine ligase, partial [Denitromonas sp.]|nr:D-alanine--D-alanine ligase [Denitromonas sp.]